MSDGAEDAACWSETDTEALFANLGRYLFAFQWIEGMLDEILLMAWGFDNWRRSQCKLAQMTTEKKIKSVVKAVLESPHFRRVHARPEWCTRFKKVMERLNIERECRNGIMHSQFLFEFCEIGGAPVRSRRLKGELAGEFEQQALTTEVQSELIKRILALGMDLGFIEVQLRHDYQSDP